MQTFVVSSGKTEVTDKMSMQQELSLRASLQ